MSRNRLTLPLLRELFTSKTVTPNHLLSFCHKLASQTNDTFNVFSQLAPLDEIQQLAEESTQRYAQGKEKSILDGVPLSIKSNIAVKGFHLTASSNILKDTAGYDCVLVQKLKDAGAIIMGTTNMDEFGMGSLGVHSCKGPTVNPLPFLKDVPLRDYIRWIHDGNVPHLEMRIHGPWLSPGGSSSGSAASVSMGTSILSIGTDTGGSIRLPAAWCGVVGLKPTYGAISRDGVVSYASSLDTVGILGPSATCVGLTLDILRNKPESRGEDWHFQVKDSTACVLESVMESDEGGDNDQYYDDLTDFRVGIPPAFSVHGCSEPIRQAWEKSMKWLQDRGATISIVQENVISPEAVKMSLPAYYVISCAEASSNLARYDGLRYGLSHDPNALPSMSPKLGSNREGQFAYTRSVGFGREVQRRILAGTAVLSSDRFHTHYEGAANIRATITQQFHQAFIDGDTSSSSSSTTAGGIDVMIIPTSLSGPPSIGEHAPPLDSTEAFQNDVMTVPISLAGLPSISIPVPSKDETNGKDLLVGMQIFGPRKSERQILRAARVLEGMRKTS